ncbi:hypothetical protein ACH5RR_024350 [Cinchona calisaya]|uniref:Uncharacterized protein n=1 Tax=Cinchona calisaya TaxID=153742 RepID=A0ABD2YWG2_9GENT
MRPRCMAVGQHALRRGFVACLQGFIEGNANNPQHPPRKPFYYYYYFVELPGHDNQQPDNNPHGHPNLQQGQVQFPPQHPPAGDAIDDDDEVLQLPDDLY